LQAHAIPPDTAGVRKSATRFQRRILLLASAGLLLAACVAPQAALHGDAAHPAGESWLRTELYFGIGAVDDANAAANDKRWRDFLDREVTPRFPDGLSVYDVYGQWRSQGHDDIERLHSKEVMILHADTAQHRADIDAIRAAWKKETGDQSVLRVTQPADVSF
jgi:hypothetical protein